MYFMNSPTMPGQNRSGEKAAIAGRGRGDHRAGHALGGQRIGLPRLGMPSAMRRSANSETMIASSTSMPTARMRREQDDDVDGQPGKLQAENAGEERRRDGDADEQRGAPAEHDRA